MFLSSYAHASFTPVVFLSSYAHALLQVVGLLSSSCLIEDLQKTYRIPIYMARWKVASHDMKCKQSWFEMMMASLTADRSYKNQSLVLAFWNTIMDDFFDIHNARYRTLISNQDPNNHRGSLIKIRLPQGLAPQPEKCTRIIQGSGASLNVHRSLIWFIC